MKTFHAVFLILFVVLLPLNVGSAVIHYRTDNNTGLLVSILAIGLCAFNIHRSFMFLTKSTDSNK